MKVRVFIILFMLTTIGYSQNVSNFKVKQVSENSRIKTTKLGLKFFPRQYRLEVKIDPNKTNKTIILKEDAIEYFTSMLETSINWMESTTKKNVLFEKKVGSTENLIRWERNHNFYFSDTVYTNIIFSKEPNKNYICIETDSAIDDFNKKEYIHSSNIRINSKTTKKILEFITSQINYRNESILVRDSL